MAETARGFLFGGLCGIISPNGQFWQVILPEVPMSKPVVMLVDGYSLIFRGFHALPLLTTANGDYTNAVHGFFSMLF